MASLSEDSTLDSPHTCVCVPVHEWEEGCELLLWNSKAIMVEERGSGRTVWADDALWDCLRSGPRAVMCISEFFNGTGNLNMDIIMQYLKR